MPTYCYENKHGKTVDKIFPIGEAPASIQVGTLTYKRSYQAERASVPATAGWPLECPSSGVNVEQAGELREHFSKAGIPTDVSERGNPIYRDAKHRKKALASRGLFDKDAFV